MLRRAASSPSVSAGRLVAVVLTVVLVLSGCTALTPSPGPDRDGAATAAAALAGGLAAKDVSGVPFAGTTGAAANEELGTLVRGMGPLAPEVSVDDVTTDDDTATATLHLRWTFPGVPAAWAYDTRAELVQEGGAWRPRWSPAVVEPSLDATHRLSQRRRYPMRGELLGEDGDPIATLRPVFRIGVDKRELDPAQARSSARRLAGLVDIDARAYAERVTDAGPEAFVEAITLRATAPDLPSAAAVRAVPGALRIQDEQMLAPSRTFARALIGAVGEATKDEVDASGGAVVAGDQVGLSGLQKRYDQRLRGTPGVEVRRVAREATPTGSAPSPSPTPSATPEPPQQLFEAPATPGQPLELTLNVGLQRLAEKVVSRTDPATALVAVRPSTGAVLAAANGSGTRGQPVATTGQYPPGSTFKVVSALALLRSGLSPDAPVDCPATLRVNGQRFKNYRDYPSSSLGRITLETAVAQSCNTAFIGQRSKLSDGDLNEAAASLGLGTDYDVGFPAYFGSVPAAASTNERAAAMIGQGKVQASPLAMAAVAASVAAGETVVPHLVDGQVAKPQGTPLAEAEASQLRQLMRAVVTEGSARGVLGGLDGPAVIAKTGTAEYGRDDPPRTHAWMIAAQGDLAVAVFVADGQSGSRTAGPLLAAFLRGAR